MIMCGKTVVGDRQNPVSSRMIMVPALFASTLDAPGGKETTHHAQATGDREQQQRSANTVGNGLAQEHEDDAGEQDDCRCHPSHRHQRGQVGRRRRTCRTTTTAREVGEDVTQVAGRLRGQGHPQSLFELLLAQPAVSVVLGQEIGTDLSLFVPDPTLCQAAGASDRHNALHP
jgi:hypothetical protein